MFEENHNLHNLQVSLPRYFLTTTVETPSRKPLNQLITVNIPSSKTYQHQKPCDMVVFCEVYNINLVTLLAKMRHLSPIMRKHQINLNKKPYGQDK